MRRRGEQKAYEESGRDVADLGGGAAAVVDQEGDDPAGDGHFGALVHEDEEGADERDSVPEGLLQQLPL